MNELEPSLKAKGWWQAQDGSWNPPKHNLGTGGGEIRHADCECISTAVSGQNEAKAGTANRNTRIRQSRKPLLNKLELRYKSRMISRGMFAIMDQAITLRLDPPYKSYRPDLAYLGTSGLCFVEVKGPHRFKAAGIAKAALAAKTYPQFRFELAEWTGSEWKERLLSN